MPRIPPFLFRKARRESSHLASLLPACRDIESARNELRWIRSHVNESSSTQKASQLARLVYKRGNGVPLQYVLGSQPFGALDIKCKPGVLVPRPETEAYTCHLSDLIKSRHLLGSSVELAENGLGIIDFCTGTGCIPLLLFSCLHKLVNRLTVRGIDISETAVQLARDNITHNVEVGNLHKPSLDKDLKIIKADVFSDVDMQHLTETRWDLLISNPPYISRDVWNHGRGQLGHSVRKYEPQLALIPDENLPRPSWCSPEDVFYSRLLDIAALLNARVILFEIGDESQACRVLHLYFRHEVSSFCKVELWRDWPDLDPSDKEQRQVSVANQHGHSEIVPIYGSGRVRSLLIQKLGQVGIQS